MCTHVLLANYVASLTQPLCMSHEVTKLWVRLSTVVAQYLLCYSYIYRGRGGPKGSFGKSGFIMEASISG